MIWYVWQSLDGWELDRMGPMTFAEACVVSRFTMQVLKGIYGVPIITTMKEIPH